MEDLRSFGSRERMSRSSSNTIPPVTSTSRGMRLSSVDFPLPVDPTIATVSPGRATMQTPCRTAS